MTAILLVEDDRELLLRLSKVLAATLGAARRSVRILKASSAEAALKMFDAERPDVVVADILIPDMDGLQLCRAIRQRPHGKDVGLIITSSVYRNDRKVSAQIRGELRGVYLAKPYRGSDLVTAVECILAERGAVAGNAPSRAPQLEPALAQPPPVSAPSTVPVSSSVSGPPGVPSAAISMDEKRPAPESFQADLAKNSIASILLDLSEKRLGGLLTIRRGRVEKELELGRGHLIWISSNQREETLGNFLIARRMITEEQHQAAIERARDRGGMLGHELIAIGALNAAQLVQCLGMLAKHKVITTLRWKAGEARFRSDIELPERVVGEPIDLGALVLTGLRDTAVLGDAASYCEKISAHCLRLTERGLRLRSEIARVFGGEIARFLEQEPTLEDLIARGGDLASALTAVEALMITGCVEASKAPIASKITPRVDPVALELLSKPSATSDLVRSIAPLFSEGDSEDVLVTSSLSGTPTPLLVPARPAFYSDSDVFEVPLLAGRSADAGTKNQGARDKLLAEFIRIQQKDWYVVLGVERGADEKTIETAHAAKIADFGFEQFSGYDLGADYQRLKELNAAYRRAKEILLIPELREAYDHQLARFGRAPTRDAFSAELFFREGERRLASGQVNSAVDLFRKASELFPSQADYHAALGWSIHLATQTDGWAARFAPGAPEHSPEAKDAREQARIAAAHFIDLALEIDPEHAAAHEYRGRFFAGNDDERALWHLTKALDAHAPRFGALEAYEQIRLRRNEFRELEYLYRRLLHRVGERDPQTAYRLWRSLGTLYHRQIGDVASAQIAYECARRYGPEDPEILRVLCDLLAAGRAGFVERSETLSAQWRFDRTAIGHLLELMRTALSVREVDAGFVSASVFVSFGGTDEGARDLLARNHPRRVPVLVKRMDDAEILLRIRHSDDDPNLSLLFAVLEPAVARMWPPASLHEAGEAYVLAGDQVPKIFGGVLRLVADELSIPSPSVVAVKSLGDRMIPCGGMRPVLLAGPFVLSLTDEIELAFRLAKVATYLWPGRAIGRPEGTHILRSLFLGAFSFVAPSSQVHDADGSLGVVRECIRQTLSPEDAALLRRRLAEVIKKRKQVHLKPWIRGLERTADRIGLIVCGDPAVALRVVRAGGAGAEELEDLADFALSAKHLDLRREVGVALRGPHV